MKTLTAKNSVTEDQVTTFTYGTTLTNSDVASEDLLRFKRYPLDTSSQRMEYKYNRLRPGEGSVPAIVEFLVDAPATRE